MYKDIEDVRKMVAKARQELVIPEEHLRGIEQMLAAWDKAAEKQLDIPDDYIPDWYTGF